jgi:hypothetical protein
MSALNRVVLDDRAAIFVQAHLSGVNGFCSALLEAVGLEAGEYFTFAPRGTPRERLYLFDVGGLASDDDLLPLEQANLLRGTLERVEGGGFCIIDDFDLTWGDPGSDDAADAFGMEEEVYHLLTADDDVQTFADVLSGSSLSWHGVAAICSAAPGLDETRTTNLDSLTEAARTASLLTCVAYDGEGFVGWRRR